MSVLQTLSRSNHEEAHTAKLHRLLLAWCLWILLLLVGFVLAGAFSFERFFVLSFVGFLAFVSLFAPTKPAPDWWKYVQIVVFLGLLVLCYFVALRAIDVLAL